jgi:DNA-binding NtrC family response regulator
VETAEESWKQIVDLAERAHMTVHEFRRFAVRRYLEHLLAENRGNQCRTAKAGGLHRNTLARQIHELQIGLREFKPESSRMRRFHGRTR